MNYGLPYQGSKNRIAKEIVDLFPKAERLIDVFCGGCAITHAALLSGKFQKIIANDINIKIPLLFKQAAERKLPPDFRKFISREEFHERKETDAIVATCYSFGNDCQTYLYNPETEKVKSLAQKMIISEDWKERLRLYRKFIKTLQETRVKLESLQRLESFERLQSLENLERLQSIPSLERFERLEVLGEDYRNLKITDSDLIYCDPPYKEKRGYNYEIFDSDSFWKWATQMSKTNKIAISEYSAPDDFVAIWKKDIIRKINSKCPTKSIECLFVHKSQAHEWKQELF